MTSGKKVRQREVFLCLKGVLHAKLVFCSQVKRKVILASKVLSNAFDMTMCEEIECVKI